MALTSPRRGSADARRAALRRSTRLLRSVVARFPARPLLVGMLVVFVVLWVSLRVVPLPTRLTAAPSTVITFAGGSPAFVFLSPDDKYRMAVNADDLHDTIDPDYVDALLRFEDRRFYLHPGVDPLAIARSLWLNLRHGRIVSGASTLTMQLVRVLEPRPRRLSSKLIEALRAVQLETRFSKEELLAYYLTFIPFGRNLEGVEAASYAYFGHGPQDLSAEEIATLLAVPQRPNQRYPSPQNQERLKTARDEIATWLIAKGRLRGENSQAEHDDAELLLARITGAPPPREIRPLPRHAPHAAFWLAAQRGGDKTRIATTLDRGLQLLAERLMRSAKAEMAERGIHNGALVLLDHRRSEARALVGNFDFWDAEHGGQIVGFDTPRSPGSALKPFIYALAVDRGLALPSHLVPDVPVAYGDYSPRNYDGDYTGLISLEEALSHSLNIPFVHLLGRLGVERFIGSLRAMGADHLREDPGYYGLSAAIGSVEISPLELAGLFAALAENGRYRRPRWLASGEDGEWGTRIFSPGSAYLTRKALVRRDRPDFPERRRLSGAPPAIHWKTGTSYGHRDAWAAGSGRDHTAVVWLGNFDNQPSVDLVGADAAGPLLFDLLEAVADRALPAGTDLPPEDLKRVEVCAYSGYLPTTACEQRTHTLALRQQVPTRVCPYHVALDIELATGLALNPSCRAGRSFERRNYLVWPASIRRWLNHSHQLLPGPPSLADDCITAGRRTPPAILSPPSGQILVLLPGVAVSDQEIPLQAESSAPGSRLSWFIDGEFLGTVPAEERLWWEPKPGRHEILVLDESGLKARQQLEVRRRAG